MGRRTDPLLLATGAAAVLYATIGLAGFVATGFGGNGTLLLFPVSVLVNIIHLFIGVSGAGALLLGRMTARPWAQGVGAVLAVATVVGVVDGTPFGVLPIGGYDVVLHGVTAFFLLYLGFAEDEEAARH
jgi:hypothetical protein